MADILQIPNCGGVTSTFNSGIPLCDVIRDIPLGLIGLDAGVGFNAAERASVAAFVTALQTKSLAARGSRAYPFWKLTNFEDISKEKTKAALGNLSNGEVTVIDGIPAFAFQHRIGEIFHQKLIEAQNSGLTWLIVDKKYVVYGTLSADLLTGFSLSDFYVGLAKFGNASSLSVYPFEMTIGDQTEYKENGRFVQADSTIVAVTGLRDVVLSVHTAISGSTMKVGLTALGGKNLTDLFATELAQAGAWSVKKVADGSSVTVSAVYDSTNKVMTLTFSGASWTGGVTGDDYTVDLAAASVLAGLASPISGYESTGALTIDHP